MGDYNIRFLSIQSHGPTRDFNDTTYSDGFIQLITRPTIVTNLSATLIGNFCTNQVY